MTKAAALLTVKEAARLIGLSSKTVHRLIRAGKLPAANLADRATRIRWADLEAYAADHGLRNWAMILCHRVLGGSDVPRKMAMILGWDDLKQLAEAQC